MTALVALPEGTLATTGRYLARALYTAEDVVHQSKTAAANVRGMPDAGAVDHVAGCLRAVAETVGKALADRMHALGVEVDWTIDAIAKGSSLQPFPTDLRDGARSIEILAENALSLDVVLREVLGQVAQVDPVSAYVITNALVAYERDVAHTLGPILDARSPEAAVTAVGTESAEVGRG